MKPTLLVPFEMSMASGVAGFLDMLLVGRDLDLKVCPQGGHADYMARSK
jgi:hypothetical protein